jgi:hypothetical protein
VERAAYLRDKGHFETGAGPSGRGSVPVPRVRCSPAPHPGQRRDGHQPAWQAGGRWHLPRGGSDGGVGGQPVPHCCGSTPQRGLGTEGIMGVQNARHSLCSPCPYNRYPAPRTNTHALKFGRQVFPPRCLLSLWFHTRHHSEQ